MACQFKLLGSVVEVDRLKSCLFTGDCTSVAADGDDSWNWTVDEPATDDWLEKCCVSLSPSSELFVFGRERNLVILNGKWDTDKNSEGIINYHISWYGVVSQDFEQITTVLCLPMAGQERRSNHGVTDWTAVAVGFSSGAIRFYTENGSLLLSELLHEESVKSIKCQSFQPQSNLHVALQSDELHVAYSTVVCSIQGFALCNSLKDCRSQLARVEANCQEKIDPPPLAFTKWSLPEQEEIADVSVLGSAVSNMFNHLTTASLRGGYLATYRSGPPQVSTVVSTGSSPFVGWHCVLEGSSGPNLTDVAKAVASKFKSAIGSAVPDWLGVHKKVPVEKQKDKSSSEPAEAMTCRYGLCDLIRKGQRIYLSPQNNLGAVCDSLGRIVLIDMLSGVALRMWKGYRDAECAFILVEEDKGPQDKGAARKALYLAIYAPKKSIVEVWALQQGPKIVSFSTTKNGRLLYVRHGLMGNNSLSPKNIAHTQHPCVYISSSGDIKQVYVPFHPILNNKNDSSSRDMYLFKQIKRHLKLSLENSSSEISELCKQISSDELKVQILETAASSKHINPDLMLSIIDVFQNVSSDECESVGEAAAKCSIACANYRKLINFYVKAQKFLDAPPEYSTVVPSTPTDDEELLSKMLKLSIDEVKSLLVLVSFSSDTSKVSFKSVENRFPVYLSNFCHVFEADGKISFSPDITTDDISTIGEIICPCVLYGGCSLVDWRDLALDSGIDSKSLLYASVAYWLKKPLGVNVRSEMSLYVQLQFLITSLSNMKESITWWDPIRTLIMESEFSLNALTSTIIARAVYLRTEKQITDEGLLDEEDENWETITRENCLWSQLLMQVESVAVLQTALSRKPTVKEKETLVPKLDYVKPDISLANLLLKGPGLVAESVAKYVASWGLEPDWFLNLESKEMVLKTDGETNATLQIDGSAEAMTTTSREDVVLQRLELLKKHFPYSLTPSHILSNLCWEYVSAWAKNPPETIILTTGLNCLRLIPDQELKLGLCSVLWTVHLKTHFENIVMLIQKIGKLPKDRLCTLHAHLPAPSIQFVLRCLVDFFTIFLETAKSMDSSEDGPIRDTKREAIWTADCQPSLVDISLAQGDPHMYIVKTQCLCAKALRFFAVFPIRLHRPVTSLLHKVEETMLWMDIRHSDTIPAPTPDAQVEEARLLFLLKVINAATDTLCAQEMNLEDSIYWISQCYDLANEWEVPADAIRIQQVINLYKNNGDRFAEEVVNSVNDKAKLGLELLLIVGQRMKKIMMDSSHLLRNSISHLSPNLSNWIQEQEESKDLAQIKDVIQLSALVVTLLPESTADHKFASLLLEGIQPLAA